MKSSHTLDIFENLTERIEEKASSLYNQGLTDSDIEDMLEAMSYSTIMPIDSSGCQIVVYPCSHLQQKKHKKHTKHKCARVVCNLPEGSMIIFANIAHCGGYNDTNEMNARFFSYILQTNSRSYNQCSVLPENQFETVKNLCTNHNTDGTKKCQFCSNMEEIVLKKTDIESKLEKISLFDTVFGDLTKYGFIIIKVPTMDTKVYDETAKLLENCNNWRKITGQNNRKMMLHQDHWNSGKVNAYGPYYDTVQEETTLQKAFFEVIETEIQRHIPSDDNYSFHRSNLLANTGIVAEQNVHFDFKPESLNQIYKAIKRSKTSSV